MLSFIFAHVVLFDISIITATVAIIIRKYKTKKAFDAFGKEIR